MRYRIMGGLYQSDHVALRLQREAKRTAAYNKCLKDNLALKHAKQRFKHTPEQYAAAIENSKHASKEAARAAAVKITLPRVKFLERDLS